MSLDEDRPIRVRVDLTGWDRVMNWRRSIDFPCSTLVAASVVERSSLEILIDHRSLGLGTHDGARRPGRRRVGTMLGRDSAGKQFWAVTAGPSTDLVLVVHLQDHEFTRAVLAVDDPTTMASKLGACPGSPVGGAHP